MNPRAVRCGNDSLGAKNHAVFSLVAKILQSRRKCLSVKTLCGFRTVADKDFVRMVMMVMVVLVVMVVSAAAVVIVMMVMMLS